MVRFDTEIYYDGDAAAGLKPRISRIRQREAELPSHVIGEFIRERVKVKQSIGLKDLARQVIQGRAHEKVIRSLHIVEHPCMLNPSLNAQRTGLGLEDVDAVLELDDEVKFVDALRSWQALDLDFAIDLISDTLVQTAYAP